MVCVVALAPWSCWRAAPIRAVGDLLLILPADHGRRARPVLPQADGTRVEYAFGEWHWFALNEAGVRAR